MKEEMARQEVIKYWMEKAYESLQSARSEQQAGRFVFAINRGYYACFYSASAVLLRKVKNSVNTPVFAPLFIAP